MAWNLRKFNDTINKSYVKHDIDQKIQYILNRSIYPLTTHLSRFFEILDEIITRRMHAANKNTEGK